MSLFKRGYLYLARRNYFDWLPDKPYLKLYYYCCRHKRLNLKNPLSYNEKLQWLKLYDRKPEYTKMVDKYAVKDYVASIIGDEYIIPTLNVWNTVDEIDFDSLPNQFVLKCTHDSGGVVICADKSHLDIDKAKETLRYFYKREYFYRQREWPYKNVPHRIIAEKFISDGTNASLNDYKFFCFDGEPKVVLIATDRDTDVRFDFFDMEFNHLPFEEGGKNSDKEIKKPINFEKMITLAKELSQGIPHVRVDFYDVNGQIYFGELTFFTNSGFGKFNPEKYNRVLGDFITLPKEKIQ
jgi:hypothetical protein